MKGLLEEILWWVLASPVLFALWVVRTIRGIRFWRLAYAAALRCANCGADISLVGIWRCRCGFTYRGHLLRACPICEAMPRMVRCYACGVTERLPQL
jgi:hypothetical protein